MRIKAIIRLLFITSAIAWLALVFTDVSMLFSTKNNMQPEIPSWLPKILLNLFILSLYYYYKLKIEKDDILNFVDLLWRVFVLFC